MLCSPESAVAQPCQQCSCASEDTARPLAVSCQSRPIGHSTRWPPLADGVAVNTAALMHQKHLYRQAAFQH